MASAFSHAIVAMAIGSTIFKRHGFKLSFLGMICAAFPDVDVISFGFGIPYGHLFGHRGITHSILFAALLSFIVVSAFFSGIRKSSKVYKWLLIYFFLCTVSHGLLDALTNGGKGIAFFAPFDNTRYFFPWRPILVSPIGARNFFSDWGLSVLKNEFIFIWMPSLTVMAMSMIIRKPKKSDR